MMACRVCVPVMASSSMMITSAVNCCAAQVPMQGTMFLNKYIHIHIIRVVIVTMLHL